LKAELYVDQGNLEMAIEAMHKALEILPNDSEMHFDLAGFYGEAGDTVNALRFYASGLDWYMEEEKEDDYFAAEGFVKRGNLISDK